MLTWLRNRIGRPSRIETAPTIVPITSITHGDGTRRGVTRTPMTIVRANNRAANRQARASRAANR